MTDSVEFELLGAKELDRTFGRLGQQVERKVAAKAVRAGASLFRRLLIKVLPRSSEPQPGEVGGKPKDDVRLFRSIGIRKTGKTSYDVGVAGPARYYAAVVEFGGRFHRPGAHWRKTFEGNIPQILAEQGRKAWAEIVKLV